MTTATGAAGIESDDFQYGVGGTTLGGIWTEVDNGTGTASYALEGQGTSDALLSMSISGQYPLDGGSGYYAIWQPGATDGTDFEITLKIQSLLSTAGGIGSEGGLIIKSTGTNYLVWGLYIDNGGERIYGGDPSVSDYVGDAAVTHANPHYLRISHTASSNNYALRQATTEGGLAGATPTNYVWTPAVDAVGVYLGNFSGQPDVTLKFDYFLETAGPFTLGEDYVAPASSRRVIIIS